MIVKKLTAHVSLKFSLFFLRVVNSTIPMSFLEKFTIFIIWTFGVFRYGKYFEIIMIMISFKQ